MRLDYTIGRRVQLAPHTDLWMMGARFGTLEAVVGGWLQVRLDATKRVHRVWFQDICETFPAVAATEAKRV